QKRRYYKTEDRGKLRNIQSSDQPKFFEKYLRDVNCSFKIQDGQEAIDWLLGLAVSLEYGDNAEKYKDRVPDNAQNADNATENAEPGINLDVTNPNFRAGVMVQANLQRALTRDVAASTNPAEEGLPVGLDKYILGFDTRDMVLNEAGQILHLLHIEELRELQTKINAARVAVQVITADPKTDHRLEKVGR
ncbi:hypothetical protein DBR06_SOUSAS26010014, partial [Sousa chinensis]